MRRDSLEQADVVDTEMQVLYRWRVLDAES